MLPRKLAMVCAKGTLDFREEVIDSVMKVILDDAHVATHLMTPGVTGMPARSGEWDPREPKKKP